MLDLVSYCGGTLIKNQTRPIIDINCVLVIVNNLKTKEFKYDKDNLQGVMNTGQYKMGNTNFRVKAAKLSPNLNHSDAISH